MDYCSTCRRHLNGALVCPGCGAYAPDIAPVTMSTWHDDRLHDDVEAAAAFDKDLSPGIGRPSHAPVATPAPHGGRAARRRQLARLKKHQRRAMIATAVALVGGGLSFATMDRHTTDRAQAATAPDDTSMGGAGEQTTGAEERTPEQGARQSSPNPGTQVSDPASPSVPRQRSATAPQTTQPPTPAPVAPQQQTASLLPEVLDTPVATPVTTPVTVQPSATSSAAATTTPAATPAPSSAPSTPATTPSSSQLCLLVICLG